MLIKFQKKKIWLQAYTVVADQLQIKKKLGFKPGMADADQLQKKLGFQIWVGCVVVGMCGLSNNCCSICTNCRWGEQSYGAFCWRFACDACAVNSDGACGSDQTKTNGSNRWRRLLYSSSISPISQAAIFIFHSSHFSA
jgi:hypothetical protein